jgi:glycosyltransferase involved in cell wall biosynthesis
MMRILVLHSRYRSGPASGENRVVEDEARLLGDAGHEVELFDPSVGTPSGTELLRTGARVVWSRDAATEVRRRIERFRPDVVHVHNLFPALSPSALRAVRGRAPVVMTLHNYRLHCLPGVFLRDGRVCEDCLGRTPWPGVIHACYQGSRPASLALAASLTLHKRLGTFEVVDLYLAISEFVRNKNVEGGLPPERVMVKPHFVWGGDVREGPGDYFLFLGRLSAEKGVSTIIEAWRGMDARLLVVGDGPEASAVRTGASSNVEFLGTVPPETARALIRSARAILVPSLSHEGAGRVVLEAYAAGVPALASRAGGLPEVVEHGETGSLIPPGDPAAWRKGAERLLDDSESERMGTAAHLRWAERYSPKQGLAQLEAAYRRAIDEGGAVRRRTDGVSGDEPARTEGERP